MGGPGGQEQWSARLERVYNNGLRNVEFVWTLREVCLRLLNAVGEYYFVPYFLARGVVPAFVHDPLVLNSLERYSVCIYMLAKAALFVSKQLVLFVEELHDHIKDEKYLIGMRLNNVGMTPGDSSSLSSRPLVGESIAVDYDDNFN